jgi:cytoskeletal protein CcmA (bactofilin family)
VIKEVSMALWNQATPEVSPEKTQPVPPALTPTPTATTSAPTPTPAVSTPKESAPSGRRESIFGPGVTIEGKIEGDADIRIGGKFKGDIQIKGDLNIDKGAKVSAKVQAANVTIGGELEGNVVAGAQVKLLESGQLIGDVKAAALTVVAGSRMRGNVEFGWSASEVAKFSNGHAQEKEKVGAAG